MVISFAPPILQLKSSFNQKFVPDKCLCSHGVILGQHPETAGIEPLTLLYVGQQSWSTIQTMFVYVPYPHRTGWDTSKDN